MVLLGPGQEAEKLRVCPLKQVPPTDARTEAQEEKASQPQSPRVPWEGPPAPRVGAFN